VSRASVPIVKLAEYVDLLAGFAFDSANFTNDPSDIPLVKGENVSQGSILWDISKRWSAAEWSNFEKYQLLPGDVIVAMDRPWVPAGLKWAYIRKDDPKALLVQRCSRLRTNSPKLDQDFLRFVVGGAGFESYIKPITTGVNVPHISGKQILDYEFLLPPLPIQQRIAGVLSAYDQLIENSQRRIEILESMAHALYREWFVHFRYPGHESASLVPSVIGDIPQGWEIKTLGDISSYINRGISPQYGEDGDSLVINQKCIRNQRLSLEPARLQLKAIPKEKQLRFGDVLINSTGVGTLGRVAQVYEHFDRHTVDSHVSIARAADFINLNFYGSCLLNHQETFERLGTGATGQTELSRAAIAGLEVLVPPTKIQFQFGEVVGEIRTAIENFGKQIQNVRLTRDLLLPRLLSGRIDVDIAA
jgi:type I restriction enzyme S subunit